MSFLPSRSRYCLGVTPPISEPIPAAGMTAQIFSVFDDMNIYQIPLAPFSKGGISFFYLLSFIFYLLSVICYLLSALLFFLDRLKEGLILLDHAKLGACSFLNSRQALFEILDLGLQGLVALHQYCIFLFLFLDRMIQMPHLDETAIGRPQPVLQQDS